MSTEKSNSAELKKKKIHGLIKQQHLILTRGCGAKKCRNERCVSSGKAVPMNPNIAAKIALEYVSKEKNPIPDILDAHTIYSLIKHSTGPLYELLIPLLNATISDPYKLSLSFTQVSPQPGIVTIDKDEVDEAYDLLFSLESTDSDMCVESAIIHSFHMMVPRLSSIIKDKPKESKLLINAMVIFLLNPKLQNPEYSGGCFAEFCGTLAALKNGLKVNLIHYISTLPSDTIIEMIYNFQMVIAIGIAMKPDDQVGLHKLTPVSEGVMCLQIVYGAVVYRAQLTIHHVLGDCGISKQLSRDITIPVNRYTSNNLVGAPSVPSGGDQSTVTSGGAKSPDIATPRAEQAQDNNNSTGPSSNYASTNTSSNTTSTALSSLTSSNEYEASNEHSSNNSANPPTTSTAESPYTRSGSELTDSGDTEDPPTAAEMLLPFLAMRREMIEALEERDEEEGEAEEGETSDSPPVESARRLLDLVAGIPALAGAESEESSEDDEDDPLTTIFRFQMGFLGGRGPARLRRPDHPKGKLFTKLGIDPLWDSHTNIDLSLFYNDNISDELKMDEDYINFKSGKGFSFLAYPFVLKPHVKSVGLHFENRINMSRSVNPLLMLMSGQYPYLKLVVKRNNIVEDALTHLEMVAEEEPQQLQRQLFVEFEGEEGVDEGGVSKEFFQLIIADLFNPNYGMFVEIEDTRMLWFNPQSFEVDHNYKLIGMLLGLAVYNNVILDIRFPTVLYQKLMGEEPDIRDLLLSHPMLGNSLQQLLDYEGRDVEEVFMLDHVASYTGLFGETITYHLVENGDKVPVTSSNKHDFVAKYVDYILNKSVSKQFDQFKKGFGMVASHSPLKSWFRPEELEKLIVGTQLLDFKALQGITRYDNGYTADSDCVKWFWQVTHALNDEDKSKLLAFSTGCGRAPVGGMGNMNFIIVKNGGDSDRLPTAHTCFNVLLLPDYSSKEKLKEKLLGAIQHFEGFGMI